MKIYSFTQKLFVFAILIGKEKGKGRRVNRRKSKQQKLRDSNKMFAKSTSWSLHLREGDSNG